MKKRSVKKFIAFALTLTLVATSIPSAFFSTASAATGPSDGQIENVGGTTVADNPTYDIEVSKTIEEVEGKENYFDITLKATTHRHTVDMSTDVVVVMDISNTMNFDPVSGSGTKLDQAKAATNQFIEQFAKDTKLSDDRRVSVVTFNQNAQVVVPLTEANDANDYTKNFKSKVEAIKAPTEPVEIKFTNIEGGLQLAKNILATSDAAYKFVVLLTDGFPTTYVSGNRTSTTKVNGYDTYMSHNDATSTYNANKTGKKADGTLKTMGYMANVSLKKMCLYGVDYSDYAAQRAQILAKELKDSGANIFSVGIGIGGMTIQGYLNAHKNKEFSTVDTNGMGNSYTIGGANNTAAYKTWLGSTIAGGDVLSASGATTYAPGDSATQLKVAYTKILKTIEQAPVTTMREFYTMDPMSEVADFIGFYDKDGNLSENPNQLVGESKVGAENTAIFGGTGNENRINWNMLQSGYTMDGKNLVYTLKYRVRLTNEQSGFKWETAHEMNDTTKLYYSQRYVDNGDDVPDGSGEVEYPIPETEGYKGSVKFQKIDGETNKALNNIEFTLKHYGDSCSVCGGDAVIADRTMKTDASGYIEFDNIPSGHEYYLSEQEMVEYAPIHDHTIIVSYGDTYVDSKAAENKIVDGIIVSSNKAYTIANTQKEPVEIQIQATKKMAESVPSEGEFQFQIKGNFVDGADHHEIVSNDGEGNIKFSKMVFDQKGEYTFEISEVVGTDANTIYDTTKHVVKVVVSETEEGTAYQAKVYVNDTEYATYVGKDNVIETVKLDGTAGYAFYNKSRADGVATLKASKVYTDGTLNAGDFTFEVTAITEGAPMPAKATAENDANGNVTFDEIYYDTQGTYEYEIAEVKGSDKSIVYDLNTYKAVITVTAPADLTSDTALQTSVKYYGAETNEEITDLPVTFTNKDRKTPEITMKGLKTMNGKTAKEGAFTFVIQEIDDEGLAIGEATEIKNGADGVIDFDAFLEGEVGKLIQKVNDSDTGVAEDKDYKIYEKTGTDSNVKYDDTYYLLQLGAMAKEGSEYYELTAIMEKVEKENIEGIFHAEYSYNIQITDSSNVPLVKFKNTSTVELNLEATKTLESEDTALKAGDYTFVLEGKSGKLQEVKNDKDGNVKFDTIKFDADSVGTHKFVVYEVEGDNQGLFYDDSLYTVSVTVSMDEYGNLSITEPEIVDEYDETFEEIEFVNKDMEPTHLHLNAQKTVNGSMPTAAQQFSFQLIDADTNTVIETIHNVHNTVAFSAIELDEKGTYNYIVKEVVPEDEDADREGIQKDGFTYDETEHKIQVVVTDSNDDSTLEKKVTVNGKEDPAEHNTVTAGAFENAYETKPVSVTIDGSKTLTNRVLTKGEFSFEIQAVTENAPMPKETTVKNNQAGKFEFGKITFNEVGTYEYKISEVVPEDAVDGVKDGISYDTTIHKIKIVVTDNGKGELKAVTIVDGSEDADVVFENDYDTTPTSVQITADKTLSGRTLQAEEFSFKLVEVDEAGNAVEGTEQIVKNGTGSIVGKVYFDSITYEEEGTYTYKISEVIPEEADKLGGVTYDNVVYTVIVKVTDNGKGQLVAKVDGKSVNTYNAGEFSNKYTVKEAKIQPEVSKVLTGRDWMNGDSFSFTLTAAGEATKTAVSNGTVKMAGTSVTIDKEDSDKKAQFGNITFTKPGEYYFAINEVAGNIENVTYDTLNSLFKVTVVDNEKGELIATTYYRDTTTFTNTYIPDPTKVILEGTKTLEGRDLKAGEFEFELKDSDGNGIETVKNAADGTFEFTALEYDAAGTYNYTIVEKVGTLAGITYDSTAYDVKVVVSYNEATGKFSKEVTYTSEGEVKDAVEFTNKYTTKEDDVKITVEKTVEERGGNYSVKEGDFQFGITPAASNPANDPIQHMIISSEANGGAVIANVKYTVPGTYVYTVNEIDTEIPGMSYDGTIYTITVVVTDDESKAELSADVTINNGTKNVAAIVFNNSYDPKDTTATIHGHKILDSDHKDLEAGEFTFQLTAATEGAPMPADADNGVAIVTNTAAGVYQFGTINYDKTGEYVYQIREVVPAEDEDDATDGVQNAGYTYDGTVYNVVVTVTDDNETGALKADVANTMVKYNGDELANLLINKYEPTPTSVTLGGNKDLTGRELAAGEFEFEIAAVTKDAPMPEDTIVSNTVEGNTEEGKFAFGAIEYEKAGEYKYTISEVQGDLGGVIYDDTIYDVVVTVTDNGTGQLESEATINGSEDTEIVFNNYYKADPAEVILEGTKELTGRDLEAEEFEFKIEAVTQGDPMPEEATVKNNKVGDFAFDKIKFNEAGTYEYEVREVVPEGDAAGKVGGITYDKTVYKVKVDVTDNGNGQLVAETTINGSEDTEIVFKNEYTTNPVDITLQIGKDFQVPEERGWLETDSFIFNLVQFADTVDNPAVDMTKAKTTASISAKGEIAEFGTITISEPGMYRFEIREDNGGIPGVTYDDTIYKVRIDVKDDGEGNLYIARTRINGEDVDLPVDGIKYVGTFTNEYKKPAAIELDAMIYGQKVLEGRELAEGMFSFEIKAETEEAPLPEATVVTNNEDGIFQFGNIIYEDAGTYEYEISEVNEGKQGYTYDNKTYKVTVTVEDVGGELKATVTGVETENKEPIIVFNNTYKNPDPISTTIYGQKVLEGRDLVAGEFKFLLMNGEEVVDSTTNLANGQFSFVDINLSEAGTHIYKVVENDGDAGGVVYDLNTVYEVEITVEDDDGQLKITEQKIFNKTGDDTEKIVFNNEYDAASTEIQLTATKTLEGRELEEGEFTFVLEDADGNVIQTVNNTAYGTITFDAIEYDEPGTFVYKMYEEEGNAKHVTYDETVYEITVNVTDDNNGSLKAEIVGDEAVPTFINTYDVPEKAPTDDGTKTGDDSNMLPFALAALASLAGAIAALFRRKKA